MKRFLAGHLDSTQVARVIYGAIIGLALVVTLEHDPPGNGVMVGTLLGTGLAVGLAELYSDVVGTEVRIRQRVRGERLREIVTDVAAVILGVSFPAVFFVLAAATAMESDTAFELAKWSGLGLIGFYGYCAARLAGMGRPQALFQATSVALIGCFLIALKALVH